FGDPQAAPAMLRELPRRGEQLAGAAPAVFDGLAVVGGELRLVVERVHVRRTAAHAHEDDVLGACGKMGGLGSERPGPGGSFAGPGLRGECGERGVTEAGPERLERVAAGEWTWI